MFKRVIWIILDSVGIGALPDAADFGDAGANTIGNIIKKRGHLEVPNLVSLGLANIQGNDIMPSIRNPMGAYMRCKELSKGKDTTTGHWEMIGIHTKKAFPTYPNGFSDELIDRFKKEAGLKGVLGNKVASGTEIINELGEQHKASGYPIVYTSADSVFQIAADESVIPVQRLYEICKIAREVLTGENEVARVIARPFIKEDKQYVRTANRRDYSIAPSKDNLLTYMKDAGYHVCGIGKIEDIFCGEGITQSIHTKNNMDGMEKTFEVMDTMYEGLIFTNLVEFDSKWGHRRDAEGYAQGLEEFDRTLTRLFKKMKDTDLLILNSDHGCDPTYIGTDHTREYIPVIFYHKGMKGKDLGIGESFADIGQTLAENFGVQKLLAGESYLGRL